MQASTPQQVPMTVSKPFSGSRAALTAATLAAACLGAGQASAQPQAPQAQAAQATPQPLLPGQTNDPFGQPIVADRDIITVTLREFASLPDIDGVPARAMT